MVFAASTRPRRGLADRVVRIRPRRYSAVANMTPSTITTISPANVPMRVVSIDRPEPALGARSPVPVTRKRPPDSVNPP
jgi:hypothetical protein